MYSQKYASSMTRNDNGSGIPSKVGGALTCIGNQYSELSL